jgi:multiple sugar transport system permease protein
MLIVLGLSIFPAAWAFWLSLQSWDGFSTPTWVGLGNYQQMVTDAALRDAVGHTILYTVLFVPASVLLGLALALLLNRTLALIGFYRTAIFLPFVASAAATGILTTYLFNPQFGLANTVLRALHLPQQGWLEDPSQAMVVITLMSLWGQAAFTTVIYLAALQDIPGELLEAARIDGASVPETFALVMVPLARPALATLAIFNFLWAWNEFMFALFILTSTSTKPLTVAVQQLQGRFDQDPTALMAGLCIATLPVIGVYLIFQRHLVRAITAGVGK